MVELTRKKVAVLSSGVNGTAFVVNSLIFGLIIC